MNNRKIQPPRPDSVGTTGEKDERRNNSDSVFGDGRVSSGHVLNITSEKCSLTFERMLSVCLPTLPPVVVFGGELVVLV